MRTLFWIILIFALAAGVVAAARYSTGYVLFVLPPYRVELSINLLLLLLFLVFILGYVLLRMVSGTMRLPARVREYRLARRRGKARTTLLSALQEFFAGRYARAEKAAASAIALGEHAGLCAVLAARAAHELRAFDRRDAYLAQAAILAPEDEAVKLVTEAELMLDERRHQEALEVLKALPRKHTAALRLELKAQQLAGNWEQVLALVDQLERRDVFDAGQAEQIRRYAQAENLKRRAVDSATLEAAWQKVPARQKKDTRVAAAAARCFIALGGCAQAQQIIEQSLVEIWDGELIGLYAECTDGSVVERIERAEAWLKQHAHDAVLLLTLGRLCALQELWGKAQSYLEASLSVEPTYTAHLALAKLHEGLGDTDAARRHYRESLELTVAQLRQVSGGRRRMPL